MRVSLSLSATLGDDIIDMVDDDIVLKCRNVQLYDVAAGSCAAAAQAETSVQYTASNNPPFIDPMEDHHCWRRFQQIYIYKLHRSMFVWIGISPRQMKENNCFGTALLQQTANCLTR